VGEVFIAETGYYAMPNRQGCHWSEDEDSKLLASIQSNKLHCDIAAEHERTTRAIMSRLRRLAVEMHTTKNMPINEISPVVGLPQEEIEAAIRRRTLRIDMDTTTPQSLQKIRDGVDTLLQIDADTTTIQSLQKIRKDVDTLLQSLHHKPLNVALGQRS
jgi:hypothetical protein